MFLIHGLLATNSLFKYSDSGSISSLVDLDLPSLEDTLAAAPKRNAPISSNTIISLPDGDGKFERFLVYENPVMAPELAEKYPEIKSYIAIGIDNPHAKAYFSHTPLGCKSMTFNKERSVNFHNFGQYKINTFIFLERPKVIHFF